MYPRPFNMPFRFRETKLRGRNEYEIYSNFVAEITRVKLVEHLRRLLADVTRTRKNNVTSSELRKAGNSNFGKELYDESLCIYTFSLCFAEHKSEEYALALANRSAVLCKVRQYESSLVDITLCLEAPYPNRLKPKIFIRQAECFKEMGESVKMRQTLCDLLNAMEEDIFGLSDAEYDIYRAIISKLMTSKVPKTIKVPENFMDIPNIEQNPNLLHASTSVGLKYHKQHGHYLVAQKPIAKGEVLIVEKAYSFLLWPDGEEKIKYHLCEYCLKQKPSLIPCTQCVECLYCDETCRKNAWKEFHQWECLAIQTQFLKAFEKKELLALRVAFKAAYSGFSLTNVSKKNLASKFGNSDNNYDYVVCLTRKINEIPKYEMNHIVEVAALFVEYLKLETDFFKQLKQMPSSKDMDENELLNKMGGSIVRSLMNKNYTPILITEKYITDVEMMMGKLNLVANAAYSTSTFRQPSCSPNSARYFVGDVSIVKAIESIKKNEKISFSQFDSRPVYMTNFEGMDVLTSSDIECRCNSCLYPKAPANYNCIACGGPAVKIGQFDLFSKTCICSLCDTTFVLPPDIIIQENIALQALRNFKERGNIEDANICLQLATRIYKPNHVIFDYLYSKLVEYYINKGNITSMIINGKKHLHCIWLLGANKSLGLFGAAQFNLIVNCLLVLRKIVPDVNRNDFCEAVKNIKDWIEELKIMYELIRPPALSLVLNLERHLKKIENMHSAK